MQEFWFCDRCRSMNRADSKRCYKCHAPQAQATMARVAQRQAGVVLTPGLDEEHRQVAWTLMSSNRYVSAWRLGYVVGAMLMATLVIWATVVIFDIVGVILLVANAGHTATFTGNATVVAVAVLAGAGFALLTVILHSVFLALTSMNAPALGAGSARFGPVRSAFWWVEMYGWYLWGAQTLWVLPYFLGRAVFGLCGPIAAIGKPKRLLEDLMGRLGVPGAYDSRLVSLWAGSWGTIVGIAYAMIAGPILLLIALVVLRLFAALAGIQITPASPGQATFFALLLFGVLASAVLIAQGVWLFALARVTMELSRRQRIREDWVMGRGGAVAPDFDVAPGSPGPTRTVNPPRTGFVPLPAYGFDTPTPVATTTPAASTPPVAPGPVPARTPTYPGERAPTSAQQQVAGGAPDSSRTAIPRTVARSVPVPDVPLPAVWLRAIQQTAAPESVAGPPSVEPAVADAAPPRPVLQPSASSLARYQVRLADMDLPWGRPDGPASNDLDIGGGI